MNKKKVLSISGIVVLLPVLIFFGLRKTTYPKQVVINTNIFTMEVADNVFTQEKGLSGHKPLGQFDGMLFIFTKPDKYGFWMKDMTFPIDIIWLDSDMKVVHIEKTVSPDTYPKIFYPESDSLYVLEISSGEADKTRLKIGDTVEILKSEGRSLYF